MLPFKKFLYILNPMQIRILIIDDDLSILNSLERFLKERESNFVIKKASTGNSALEKLNKENFDVIILDLSLPDIRGEELANIIRKKDQNVIIIIVTAFGTVQSVINLFKIGISDYILKPFELEEVLFTIRKHLEAKRLKEENITLRKNLIEIYKPEALIGTSKVMKEVYEKIIQVAHYNVNVLIEGESGVGKEVVARSIHFLSARKDKPFYVINCGAIPTELLESELFGYRKGAFTGAIQDKKGIFEEASGSSLFLDEINELPLSLQPKLLRTLQEKTIRRIGDNKEIYVDFRLISASSKNLKKEVMENRFREDLFYRINVFLIKIPPLRERKEDIPLLINHFIEKYKKIIGKEIKGITEKAMKKCLNYDWYGNVRELENVVQRAIILAKKDYIDFDDIIIEKDYTREETFILNFDFEKLDYKKAVKLSLENIDKIYIKKALEKTNYNKKEAAKLLGISLRALHYKINKLFPELKKKKN
jgi:DNA-binding NtrC family response regulator